MSYDFQRFEARWRQYWRDHPPAPFDLRSVDGSAKFYNLVEFPYPSAEGLHVGNVFTYCGADTLGRYLTMNGHAVFQPIGWDAFGIHTENYALKIGENPRVVTDRATAAYKGQLERIGANWNWQSELRTDDPAYYRWTQWIFVQMYRAGLAVRRESKVLWCPSCLTVLAFEQVDGDLCERCGTRVTSRQMKQWHLRITEYADVLLDELEKLDWSDISKRVQREWIGRSTGANVTFALATGVAGSLTAFTTRVDTLFGVTYVAVAPEHPLVGAFAAASANREEIRAFVERSARQIGTARFAEPDREQPGVFTDVRAVHPLTGAEVPVVVADYVVADYGSGAVMGVPAHDTRDFEFARRLGLPIRHVVDPAATTEDASSVDSDVFLPDGILVNSGQLDGLPSAVARERITERLTALGLGGPATTYRLHDWLVSRQRYWGTPIPIVYCPSCGEVPVPESQLPVRLPDVDDVVPSGDGRSPLATVENFVATTCPTCGQPAERETDVLDAFVESSWYFLRYPSYDRTDVPWDREQTATMLPVDMYAGGREHAARHHLYARFVTRVMHDLGFLPFTEPFRKLRLHGLIVKDGAKMSKSRGNVVNPDDYIDRFGADNLRAYLMFCGPWEEGGDFNDRSLIGVARFNVRLWDLICRDTPTGPGVADTRPVPKAIAKISHDIERLKFNTAIAELMSLSHWLRGVADGMSAAQWLDTCRVLLRLLAPFEPYLAEELWSRLGEQPSVHAQPWPVYDPSALVEDVVRLPVQVNGKVRATIVASPEADQQSVLDLALTEPAIRDALSGASPARVVYVPGRALNLVL
jgi:leucyl-tRNA synthetase